jgi:uncharacterized membrane protein YczE
MRSLSRQTLRQILWYYAGIIIMCLGYAMIIKPAVGAGPWDIFHLGIVHQTGIPLGFVVQLIGLAIVLLDLKLRIQPTLGMILNMITVGPIMSTLLALLPMPTLLTTRWLMLLVGIFLAGLGTAWYVSAGIGSGPRDGLMIGLTQRINLPISIIKNGIDVTVALVGWAMGGPLGVGTVVVAIAMGPSVQVGLHLMAKLRTITWLEPLVQPVVLKQA